MGMTHVRAVYSLRAADHPGLGGARKSVYAFIAHHANHKNGRCSLKFETIELGLGISYSSVEKAAKWLERYQGLGRTRNRRADRRFGAYTFTLPGHIAGGGPEDRSA